MPRSPFPLQPVQQVREAERDQHRRQLQVTRRCEAAFEAAAHQIEHQLQQLERTLRDALTPGVLEIGELQWLKKHQHNLRLRLHECRQQCANLRTESQQQQQALKLADRQVRVMERLAERYQQRQVARHPV